MLLGKVEYSSRELVSMSQRSVSDRCSACSVASIAAMVARVQLRAVLLREMRGESGRASGRKAGGARPVRSASRQALRSAASSYQHAELTWNWLSALKAERP